MLYCPKCQQTYREGTQRFCVNDNARLLPAPSSGKSANQTGGVFTNVFSRVAQRKIVETRDPAMPPDFAGNEPFQNGFRPPSVSKIFKPESGSEQKLPMPPAPRILKPIEDFLAEASKPIPKPEIPAQKPPPRIIRTNEVPAS